MYLARLSKGETSMHIRGGALVARLPWVTPRKVDLSMMRVRKTRLPANPFPRSWPPPSSFAGTQTQGLECSAFDPIKVLKATLSKHYLCPVVHLNPTFLQSLPRVSFGYNSKD